MRQYRHLTVIDNIEWVESLENRGDGDTFSKQDK